MRISCRKLSILLFLVLLAALVIRIMVLQFGDDDEDCFYRKAYDQWEETAVCRSLPLLSFSQEEHPQNAKQLVHEMVAQSFPWYVYEKLYLLETAKEETEKEIEKETKYELKPERAENLSQITRTEEEKEEEILRENVPANPSKEDYLQTDEGKEESPHDFEKRLQESMADSWAMEIARVHSYYCLVAAWECRPNIPWATPDC